MKTYYPFGDFFIKEVRKANSFLSNYDCTENVYKGTWEVSITYECKDFIIKHSFGDREIYFNTLVGISRFDFKRYGLWEWNTALKVDWPNAITGQFIGSEEDLGRLIKSSAKCFEENSRQIIRAKKRTIKFMEKAREEVLKKWYQKS